MPYARPLSPSSSPSPAARLAALLLLVLACGVFLTPTAARASSSSPPVLTGREQRIVLDRIDDICGDSWCEGDHRFDFRSFTCAPARQTCTLRLRLAPYNDGPVHWYWRSGQVTGFTRFPQMVATSPTGATSLTPAFYAAIDELVGRVEATVPAHRRAA